MLAATCLAIFLIPVLFVVVERRLGSMRGKTQASADVAPASAASEGHR
jgi:hypothetical protein